MIENFAVVQSLILLLLSVDRYCSLFPNYSPFVKKKFVFCCVALLPYKFGLVLFDYDIMTQIVSANSANVIRYSLNRCLIRGVQSMCINHSNAIGTRIYCVFERETDTRESNQ